MKLIDDAPWALVLLLCATLGLAPFTPEPHIWEKLRMLAAGDLRRGIDWFDLALHGAPWLVLALKAARAARGTGAG